MRLAELVRGERGQILVITALMLVVLLGFAVIWQLIATLSDGSQHSVWIQIK